MNIVFNQVVICAIYTCLLVECGKTGEKKQAKKEFRRTVRIEIAKLRNKEKENIFKRNKDKRYQNVS
jgi:hypothetical protein